MPIGDYNYLQCTAGLPPSHTTFCAMCQFGFFLILILFFKAREQIEKENENKSEDQQLDSSKQAMDEEDEDLLATIANKILES